MQKITRHAWQVQRALATWRRMWLAMSVEAKGFPEQAMRKLGYTKCYVGKGKHETPGLFMKLSKILCLEHIVNRGRSRREALMKRLFRYYFYNILCAYFTYSKGRGTEVVHQSTLSPLTKMRSWDLNMVGLLGELNDLTTCAHRAH